MKLLILDKDNTVTTSKSGEKFVQHPADQVLLPGVASALENYSKAGWLVFLASNQGRIAAGHKTIEDAAAEMKYAIELTNHKIDGGYFCPDFEGQTAYCIEKFEDDAHEIKGHQDLRGCYRKPQDGMLQLCIRYAQSFLNTPHDTDSGQLITVFVGDQPEDEQAAIAADVKFFWANEWRSVHARP